MIGIAEERRLLVVDLVPQNHPNQPGLIHHRRRVTPVRDRGILHPPHIGHVVDVAQLIDVRGLDEYRKLVSFDGLAHPVAYTSVRNAVVRIPEMSNRFRHRMFLQSTLSSISTM